MRECDGIFITSNESAIIYTKKYTTTHYYLNIVPNAPPEPPSPTNSVTIGTVKPAYTY